MTAGLPAILGGAARFPEGLPLVRPTLGPPERLAGDLEAVIRSGMLTNGPQVRRLEEAVAERLGVAHVVAVSSCTAGLMLVYQALGVRGPVVMPSFTFSASAHAVVWAGGSPRFVDVDAERGLLDPTAAGAALDGAVALSATHLYGSPAPVEALDALAAAAGVPVVYDAAHALGSERRGIPVGRFGSAEVFSLSPTKVVVAGEGGLVATADGALAEAVRLGRDYGNPGDYDTRFAGLNARMSELHATLALDSLGRLDGHLARRGELVERFAAGVADVEGLHVVRPEEGDRSTFKDLTIRVDPDRFGLAAPELGLALRAEGIDSRRYYHPPVHRQRAYVAHGSAALPVTDHLASSVLSPPLWSHLTDEQLDGMAAAIVAIHEHAPAVRGRMTGAGASPSVR